MFQFELICYVFYNLKNKITKFSYNTNLQLTFASCLVWTLIRFRGRSTDPNKKKQRRKSLLTLILAYVASLYLLPLIFKYAVHDPSTLKIKKKMNRTQLMSYKIKVA